MTKDQLNVAIAVHFGWKKCVCGDEHCGAWFPPGSEEPALLPDFIRVLEVQSDEFEAIRRKYPHDFRYRHDYKYPVLSKEQADEQRKEKRCSCPSVACELHGLPPGYASGGW